MDEAPIRELIRALLFPQEDRADLLVERYGNRAVRAAAAGTFMVAAERHFGSSARVSEISDYVAQVRRRYAHSSEVDPLLAEALIRSVLGEEQLAEGVPRDEAVATELFLAGAMLEDERLSDPELEGFLSEVADLVVEGLADSQA